MKWSLGFKEHKSENKVKGVRGSKVKVLVQGLHMTYVIFLLVYNFKFFILNI
jgi:hypothetical protein